MSNIFNRFLLTLYLLILIYFLVYTIFINSSNHTGFNVFPSMLGFSFFSIVLSIFVRKKLTNNEEIKINNIHFLIIGIIIVVVILCDIFNIMIYYDTWIKRGQPERGNILLNLF